MDDALARHLVAASRDGLWLVTPDGTTVYANERAEELSGHARDELTLAALREVQAEAEQDATPPAVKARINETLTTMQMFDDWYRDVSRLPRSVQLSVIKLGGRIARFLPKSKDRG